MDDYPERPSFWAMRVQREFSESGAIMRLSSDAYAMVCLISGIEDEFRYSGPVCCSNERLAKRLNWSEKTMRRVRASLVDAGWLHYEPGRRQINGQYWTLDPTHGKGDKNDPLTGTHPEKGDKNDSVSGRQRATNGHPNGDQTSFLDPKPKPDPKKNMVKGSNGSTDKSPFDLFWDVVSKKSKKGVAVRAWDKAVARVTKDKGVSKAEAEAFIIDRMKAFAPTPMGQAGTYCPGPAVWLNGEQYDDDPETWEKRDNSNGTARPRESTRI